jgi:dTDP-4-dehydrorhamnose 3,5-epimerase
MEIYSLGLPEVKIIKPKKFGDHRGYFSETFNCDNLSKNDVNIDFVQDNQSHSVEKNILRGLHFQSPPFAQDKLVRCLSGSFLDVAIDIRKDSKNYGKFITKIISADNFEQILVPKGFAHGILTLEPDTILLYKVSNYYSAENDHGLLWCDNDLNIPWGVNHEDVITSEKDMNQPKFKEFISPF